MKTLREECREDLIEQLLKVRVNNMKGWDLDTTLGEFRNDEDQFLCPERNRFMIAISIGDTAELGDIYYRALERCAESIADGHLGQEKVDEMVRDRTIAEQEAAEEMRRDELLERTV